MEKDEIYLDDVKRILIGHAPLEFLLEVTVHTLITYLFVLVIVAVRTCPFGETRSPSFQMWFEGSSRR
jgi:hypothetical protein